MAGITGLGNGIGSGMDIKGVVGAIVAAEKAPKDAQLQRLESKTTTQLTSLGQLKSAISNFQSGLSALNSPSSFLARSVSSSDSAIATSTASQSAVAGTYKVEVNQLASGSKVALAAVSSDPAAKLSAGTLTVSVGTKSLDITVDATNNTLSGVRDAINKSGNELGVTATIISDDQGSRLVLTSNQKGEGKDVVVSVSNEGSAEGAIPLGSLAFKGDAVKPVAPVESDPDYDSKLASYQLNQAAYEKSGRTLAVAQSAKFTIDGLAVTRDTNSISDVVSGLSFDLKATGATTLAVSLDEGGVKKNVEKFVEAYNTLVSFINAETKVTPVNDTSKPVVGALVGDSSARALISSVRSQLVSPQGSGSLKALADMGITTKKDGTLEMDSAKVSKAITNDFEGVAAYFTGDTGLTTRLGNVLKPYTDGGGILQSRTDALQSTINKVDEQKKAHETRMKGVEERLFKQFNAMDSLVAQLMNTSSSLTQLFDSMPGFSPQRK